MHTPNPQSLRRKSESRRKGRGKSWQSLPHHGNHGSNNPCHSERSEEPTPFANRKAARGMHTSNPQSLQRNPHPEGKVGKNHGNHYPIMAIMVQTPHVIPSAARNLPPPEGEGTGKIANRKAARGMPNPKPKQHTINARILYPLLANHQGSTFGGLDPCR